MLSCFDLVGFSCGLLVLAILTTHSNYRALYRPDIACREGSTGFVRRLDTPASAADSQQHDMLVLGRGLPESA